MDQSFDIQTYMTRGVERVVGDIVRTALRSRDSLTAAAREAACCMKSVRWLRRC